MLEKREVKSLAPRMSKSLGNAVGIDEAPRDIWQAYASL